MSRERLLAAAAQEFAEHGYRAATVQGIATRAGTTKPTMYAHFGDKESLLVACLRYEADAARTYLLEQYHAAEGLSGSAQTEADVLALFDYARDRPHGFKLLMDITEIGPTAGIREQLLDDITTVLAEQLRPRLADPSSTARARLIAAMAIGAVVHAARQTALDTEADGTAATTPSALVTSALRGMQL